jgi:acetylornithine deacetylase/succinyl-diaminopimelate desuccinylase family protein
LYTGHTDTMPLSGVWTDDPHSGAIRDGKLYGRGSVDMKGGLAAMAVAAAAIARSGARLRGRLIFAGVIDEEKDSQGTHQLVKDGIQANWAVISEPTNNVPVTVSNGQINFEFILHGQSGHGSTPSDGHNAIYDGILLVNALRRLMEAEFPQRDYPLLGTPSFSVGTFHGGVQTSIIPDHCRITVDRRVVPNEKVDDAITEVKTVVTGLRQENPGLHIDMNVFVCIEPVTIPIESPVVQALRRATAQVCGADPGVAGLRATTDAATLCNDGGIPTVIMGPGSIDEAHKADEFIPIDQLVDATRIFALAALELLA